MSHSLRRFRFPVVFALLAVALAFAGCAHDMKTASLYDRLGGRPALEAVTDDFLGRLADDPSLGRFFIGHSDDSVMRIRNDIVDFICVAAGGPCIYTGRTMKVSHQGLGITEKDWDGMVVQFLATLDKFKVPQREQGELVAAVASIKGDIVEAGS